MEGPFFPIKNRSMNKSWYYRKLGDGREEEVSSSWLVYSPCERSLFCFCCVLYPVLSNQAASQLVQETGFYQFSSILSAEDICRLNSLILIFRLYCCMYDVWISSKA